jgi:EmrB/QacA subfamily drug resistance transporter
VYEGNNISDRMVSDKIYDKKVKNTALLVVALGSFLIPFMGSSLNIALPIIQKDLAVNIILLSWIPTVFVLANAAFILPFGRLGDIIGRKKIFTYGVIIYTTASLLAGISNSGTSLIVFSFMQGFGCSMIFATGVALLSSVYPAHKRGEALGIYVTAVYIGLFLGPILGGFLAQNFGWRSIFLFNIPFGLLLILLIKLRLPGEWKGSEGDKFELKGSLIYTLSIVAILYGFSSFQTFIGRIMLIIGILGFLVFLLNEKRSINPILRLSIFKSRVSSLSALSLLLMNIATTAMWALLSLYFQDILHLGPQITALIISVQPLMVALLSTPVGRLSDRFDIRIFAVAGMIVTTIGLLILSQLNYYTSLLIPITGLLLVGIGLGLFASPTTNRFIESIEGRDYGMGSATLSTMIYTGQTMSLGIMLFIFAIFLGNVQITTSNFQGFLISLKTAFTVFAAVSGLGLIVTILNWKK